MGVAERSSAPKQSKELENAIFFMMSTFLDEMDQFGPEIYAKIDEMARTHGDTLTAEAIRNVGPRAVEIVEEAGLYGGVAIQLLADFGAKGAAVARNAQALEAIDHYGAEISGVLVRHAEVGPPLVHEFGFDAAAALAKVSVMNGRKLGDMASEGILTPELLVTVLRFGDPVCDYIWRYRWSLADSENLSLFLQQPEEFVSGRQVLPGVPGNTDPGYGGKLLGNIQTIALDPDYFIASLVLVVGILTVSATVFRGISRIANRLTSKGGGHVG
jgi:hypothetical protein